MFELPPGHIDADGVATVRPEPPSALAGSAAHLEHLQAGEVTQQLRVGLVETLGTPDEPDIAQELAVLGLVLVGAGVPPPAIGADGLRRPDRTPGDPRRGAVRRPAVPLQVPIPLC